ncbi:AfsR/SARP family transcriptional regulator [Virgisporangium aurantiacum]|uniref:SARP family transcriptional regulator n=1 Tax=Virgisporangium aurantiacum TaxID=175570 RepID=A0A8J4E5U5_9ACTN|nr:AfsR/SARP family transcriptional regulator [Virgisporangium aurantiacum]GIJ62458.1 SARP family transcriptional regulator [Virgisporangium aurantiacum]
MPAFRLLGPFEMRDRAGLPVALPRRKQRSLLAFLLLRAGTVVGTDEIVDALWGDRPPASARANLHSYMSALRTALARAAPADSVRPRSVAGGYVLDVRPDESDVGVFDALVVEGRQALAEARHEAAADVLTRALGLWRGPAMEGLGQQEWLVPFTTRLEESRLAAVEDQAEARLYLGRHAEMTAELALAVAQHPFRERINGLYIQALHRAGRRPEALAVYNRLSDVLDAEFGTRPSPYLRTLHRQIRADDLVGSPGRTSLPPTGVAPVAALGPALLPPDIPDFTGRAEHLRTLTGLLDRGTDDPPHVLMVAGIAGMAGVGKTALAVHIAHRLAASYPDGQLHVNLHGAEHSSLDPAEVLARFLRAFGVDWRAIPADLAERSALYRSRLAGRRVLIVLDNAASEQQVRPLLPGSPTCAVLVTSRRRLTGVEGARWLDLDVLSDADAVRLLASVVADDRIARQPAAAVEIVRLCGRLPLAVRIAGARLASRAAWRPSDLVQRLGDQWHRLDHLTAGDLEVRASLALSRDGLDPDARRLFGRLGMFAVPDFTVLLAAAVLDTTVEEAGRHVESLVDAQLLMTSQDGAGQFRYRFHDLVRLYARERAEIEHGAEELAGVLTRGFGAWLAVAERIAERIPGPCYASISGSAPRPVIDWQRVEVLHLDPLAWFDAERATLVSAVRQASDIGLDEVAFDLAGCLEKYFDLRGMYSDWEATNARVMEVCRRAGNLRGQAVMLRGLIDVRTWVRSHHGGEAMAEAHESSTRLLEMFTRLGDLRGMSDATVMASWALAAQGQQAAAIQYAERALRLADRSGHLGGQARAHVALAVARREQAQLEAAISELMSALTAARRLGNCRYEATVLQFLGIGHSELGNLAAGERLLTESLAISRRFGDDYTGALSLITLARIHLAQGDARAHGEAENALSISREYRMDHHAADALAVLGEIDLAEGRAGDAVARLSESVAIWRTRGWLSYEAAALTSLGRAYVDVDPGAAWKAFESARDLYCRLGRTADVTELDRLLDEVAAGRRPDRHRDA